MTKRYCPARAKGFTLIEMIMVIVITGVIGSMVAIFIKTSFDSYLAAERRAELTDAADSALRRLARDVRLALPNSVRVTDSGNNVNACATGACFIEFIPTTAGGRYRAAGDGSTGGSVLDFTNAAKTTFDVLGPVLGPPAVNAGDHVVVYNLGPGSASAQDAYRLANCAAAPGCNIATIAAPGATLAIAANVFAAAAPPLPSPNDRFLVVPSTGPVTYGCAHAGAAAGPMTRYTGYGFNPAQPSTPPAGGTAATALENATCEVDYAPTAMARTGILYVRLYVTDAATGESIALFREIHVDNTP